MNKKANEKKDWVEFPPKQYQQEASRLVHFSSKTVNSNAPACGVRVARESTLDLPVVGVRTLLADAASVPLDYTRNAGQTATVVKQMRLAQNEQPPEGVQAEQLQAIRDTTESATAVAYEEGTDWVSPRLRQILLPKGKGEYLAITPLGSGGLSVLLNRKLEALPERNKKFRHALLGIGGSNPQNVGALVREMRNPLIFRAPMEDPVVRRVLSIHFKGIELWLPRKLMEDYRAWRDRQIHASGGSMPSTMWIRQREEQYVRDIARVVVLRSQQARQLLEAHRERLPLLPDADSLLSPTLDDEVIRGLIEPETRDAKWADKFSRRIAQAIASYRFGTEGVMLLADSAVSQIKHWIKESVQ